MPQNGPEVAQAPYKDDPWLGSAKAISDTFHWIETPGQPQDALKGDYVSQLAVDLGKSGDSLGIAGIYGTG